MTDPPRPSSGPFATASIPCPTHGLRFDPAVSLGCIRCRTSSRAPGPSSGSRAPWLAAALVLLVAGGAAWVGFDRFSASKPASSQFSDARLLDEARHVRVAIYSATWCPSCDAAKSFLWKNDVPFEEHDIDKDKTAHDRWLALNPQQTIPVIDVEGEVLVGADPKPIVRALMKASERHLVATSR